MMFSFNNVITEPNRLVAKISIGINISEPDLLLLVEQRWLVEQPWVLLTVQVGWFVSVPACVLTDAVFHVLHLLVVTRMLYVLNPVLELCVSPSYLLELLHQGLVPLVPNVKFVLKTCSERWLEISCCFEAQLSVVVWKIQHHWVQALLRLLLSILTFSLGSGFQLLLLLDVLVNFNRWRLWLFVICRWTLIGRDPPQGWVPVTAIIWWFNLLTRQVLYLLSDVAIIVSPNIILDDGR